MPNEASRGSFYSSLVFKRRAAITVLVLLVLAASFVSLSIGSYSISVQQFFSALVDADAETVINRLVWGIRLPRVAASILAGAILGLSGCILQALLKNPLASPSTLGVSQGAAFGAACAIILFGAGQTFSTGNEQVLITSRSVTALCAFIGALLPVLLISVISSMRQASSESMVLSGVALGAFLSACTMLLQYFSSDMQVAATLFWTFGDLGKGGWQEVRILALLLTPALLWLIAKGWSLNALQAGEEVARSLGVHTSRLRVVGLLIISLLVAVTTAFLGIIAFVGLMAPHLVRPFAGTDQRYLIPASTLCGALLLIAADCVSRVVIAPVIIPVGIITSFAGAPLFLWLLLRRRQQ